MTIYGAEFKLDVGLYRLNQQVACQRIGKNFLDATSRIRNALASVANLFAMPSLKLAPALV